MLDIAIVKWQGNEGWVEILTVRSGHLNISSFPPMKLPQTTNMQKAMPVNRIMILFRVGNLLW